MTERIENLNGPHLKTCPKCKGQVDRIISRSAIQFKGSGWYVTDYAKTASSASAGESGKSEAAPPATAAAEKSPAGADTKSKGKPAAAAKGKKSSGAK
jgi:predicted nucleic acid-binding Zn ribbon protein